MGVISNTILSYEEGKANYDAVQKELLANHQILAHIVKRFVREFEHVPLREIETQCIEPESVKVSKVFVEKNLTNLTEEQEERLQSGGDLQLDGDLQADVGLQPEMIEGVGTEDSSVNEGRITYDILFRIRYPDESGRQMGMYINVEAQNAYYPGYPIEMRALYYAARKFGSQLRSIRKGTDYGKLEKVYSIWLCMGNIPKQEANTARLYRYEKNDIIGAVKRDRKVYDLINVVIVRINDLEPSEDGTLGLLQSLCSNRLKREEKLKKLKKYGLRTEGPLEGGVDRMCNLSELVERRGVEQGIEQGKLEKAQSIAISMLRDGMPYEQVAKYAGVSVDTLMQWERETLR